jgi:hypothetical protein
MPRVKYPVRDDFFNTWSPAMAYTVGFITADGNISKSRIALEISLKDSDVEILEYVRDLISPSRPISRQVSKDKRNGKLRRKVRLFIYSKKIILALEALGITPHKTGREVVPLSIPQEMVSHYIRGVFDGDGHVSRRSDCPLDSGITSASKSFLLKLQRLAGGIGRINKGSNGVWVWRMATTDSLVFRDFIYADADFALERKRQVFFSFEASDFQRKKFTKEDDEYLSQSFAADKKWVDVAEYLNRDVQTVLKRTKRLGLSKQSRPTWTTQEIEYLVKEFDPSSPAESASVIAKALNKTESAVNHKATRLKLRLSHNP